MKRNTVYDLEQSVEVKFTWANIVNKVALRRMDTLIRHVDRPAKHHGLLLVLGFWFSFFNVYNKVLVWFSLYNLKAKTKTEK